MNLARLKTIKYKLHIKKTSTPSFSYISSFLLHILLSPSYSPLFYTSSFHIIPHIFSFFVFFPFSPWEEIRRRVEEKRIDGEKCIRRR
jgi:hypothetical protein